MKNILILRPFINSTSYYLALFFRLCVKWLGPNALSKQPENTENNNYRLTNLKTHCTQVTLDVFIKCLVHNDYSGLIIRGRHTQQQLAQAWEYLYMEYCDLSGSISNKRILSLAREIGMMEARLLTIRTAVLVLSVRYSQRMVDLLHKYGYRFSLDPNTGKQYLDELETIIKKSKTIVITIEQKRHEYEEMMKQHEGERVTEQYFDELLVELSRFMSFRLIASDITLTEFVAMHNRYEKECRMLQREHEKMKLSANKYSR